MTAFTHLYGVTDGDTETEFIMSSKGYTPPSAGSGKVDEGNYELVVNKAFWRKKKQGSASPGVNMVLEMKVSGPNGTWINVPITVFQPQPQSDDAANDLDYIKWQRAMVSLLSGLGKADTFLGSPGDVPIKPSTFVGKRLYARLRNGEGRYANRSEVHYWMRKEEYDAKPGPDANVMPQQGGAQTSTPEVGAGQNGEQQQQQQQAAAAPAQESVASILGI